jgi:hypothetical protein
MGPVIDPAPAIASLDQGILRITGTQRADAVTVKRDGRAVQVVANGRTHSFPLAAIKSLEAKLGAGNDVFAAKGQLTFPMTIEGEKGNDNIRGGRGNDRIHGGSGNDTIVGDEGTDTLIGGMGADVIDAQYPQRRSPGGIVHFILLMDHDVIDARDDTRDQVNNESIDEIKSDRIDRLAAPVDAAWWPIIR